DIERCTPREFRFRATREQYRTQSREPSNAGTDARTFTTTGDGSDSCTRDCSSRDGSDVFSFSTRARNFSFRVGGFLTAGIRASWRGKQVNRVAVRQDQRLQPQAKFPFSFDASRPLAFEQRTAKIGANWNHDLIVLCDRKSRMEIERIASPRAAGRNAIFEHDGKAGSGWNGKSLTWRTRRGGRARDRWRRIDLRTVGLLRGHRKRDRQNREQRKHRAI